MSAAVKWLSAELGWTVPNPDITHTTDYILKAVCAEDGVIIFGAGSGGRLLFQELEKRGAKVLYFLDNFATGHLCGKPIYKPNQSLIGRTPLVYGSLWQAEIHQALVSDGIIATDHKVYPLAHIQAQLEWPDAAGFHFKSYMDENLQRFQKAASLWDDAASRQLYLSVLALRMGFYDLYAIPQDKLPITGEIAAGEPLPSDTPVEFDAEVTAAITGVFKAPHYISPGFAGPKEGDVILDVGAWFGDTAYWFAKKAGTSGHVYALEPSQENHQKLCENIKNFGPVAQVTPVKKGVGLKSETVSWEQDLDTMASRVGGAGLVTIDVTSIDDFIGDYQLEKLNIIKSDVEGLDLDLLKGATATISRFMPDLSISMYHSPEHMAEIPIWIHENFPDYRMRITQNCPGITETICMATVR